MTIWQPSNRKLEIKTESPNTETAISQTQATVSEKELSSARVARKIDGVNKKFSVRNRVDSKAAEVLQKENKGLNWGIKKNASLDGGSHDPKATSSDVSSDAFDDAALDGGRRGPRVASSGVSSAASDNNITEDVAAVKDAGDETETVAVEGKSFAQSSGQVIEPQKVATIKGGKVSIEAADGQKYDASDVSFATADEELLWQTTMGLKNITAEGANAIIQASRFKTGSMNSYVQGAAVAYRSGYLGMEIPAEYAQRLTAAQREVIYNAGKKAAGQAVAKAQSKVAVAKNATTTKGGRVHFEGDYSKLTKRQAASLSALETVADVLGVQIYVFESQVDAAGNRVGANGWYDPSDSSIHIDLHSGADGNGTMLFTAAHELVHFIKQWSPAKFKVLANFLMKEYGKKGVSVDELVQNQIAKANRDGRELSYDEAYEEVIADSMETMLSDGKVMEKLAKLKQQDRSLWQKIKDYVLDLAAKIRKVYEGLTADSAEGRYVAQMADAAQRLQELFTEGLVDASRNFAGAEKNTQRTAG